ncbi:alpha-hydroxy acid oxidase [Terrihabitans soli]|uniref:alpha-hydroxy acid oxidase n=1 Tax=Terrihabitans soli TaxID=708113 RepID=UPI001CA35446|nr:alpha-hydroxy acid oxidase [Terrihabitans soli]
MTAARAALSDEIWDYLIGGSETETTVCRNRQAIESLAFRPRVLRRVDKIDTGADFLGKPVTMPVFLAPVGSIGSFWENAPDALGRAATDFGVPVFGSAVKAEMLDAIAAAASGPKVFQIYTRGDRAWIDGNIERVAAAGYDACAITVDNAVTSRRERDMLKGFEKPWRKAATGMNHQAAFDWDDVKYLRDKHAIKLIIKGINTAEDAAKACEIGVDVVHISNHGGRQLDSGRGTLKALPEVVAAVKGRAKIFIDGGFCRGTDIVKALILGADMVGIGRMYLYGLATDGYDGVTSVLNILENEIATCMALLGAARLSDLDGSLLEAAVPVYPSHVHSAFPLLSHYQPK